MRKKRKQQLQGGTWWTSASQTCPLSNKLSHFQLPSCSWIAFLQCFNIILILISNHLHLQSNNMSSSKLHIFLCESYSCKKATHNVAGVGNMPGRFLSKRAYQQHQIKEALRVEKERNKGPPPQPESCDAGPSQASANPYFWNDWWGMLIGKHNQVFCNSTKYQWEAFWTPSLLAGGLVQTSYV